MAIGLSIAGRFYVHKRTLTHRHGDHFVGIPVLKKHWPNWDGAWLKFFPGDQIATPVTIADPLDTNTFHIGGHALDIVEVGHTDTFDTTVLHVPDLELVVAGDAVYGDIHQYFGEVDTTEKRLEWIKAIEKIEALNPKTVVAGRKRPGLVDGAYYLQSTKEYIKVFEDVVKVSGSDEEIVTQIKSRYPDRVNPHAIMAGAFAAMKGKQN
ncbi:hypothetical protein QQX98_002083 [Neonectria punicea]|uniref:Metallo-beta-lactamase domain-containing protein n=1 Tax=Neonectria punicea TaxID=979145 RepID=A0ABR1HKI0_9HYPO